MWLLKPGGPSVFGPARLKMQSKNGLSHEVMKYFVRFRHVRFFESTIPYKSQCAYFYCVTFFVFAIDTMVSPFEKEIYCDKKMYTFAFCTKNSKPCMRRIL